MKKRLIWCLFLYFSLLMSLCGVAYGDGGEGYTDHQIWGFFWYKDEMIKEEEEPAQDKSPQKYPPLIPDRYTYKELWDLHPDLFKEIIDNRLKLAVQHPEDEINVLKFLEAQDIAKRKSLAFTGSMNFVAQKYPQFDEDSSPQNIPGKNARQQMLREKQQAILSGAKDDFGLIVFVSSDCGYCEAQSPIIEQFEFQYRWLVEKYELSEYRELASKYDINTTPAIIIVSKKDGTALSISRGVITLSELQDRVTNAVLYLTGKSRPEQFNYKMSRDPYKFKNAAIQPSKEIP